MSEKQFFTVVKFDQSDMADGFPVLSMDLPESVQYVVDTKTVLDNPGVAGTMGMMAGLRDDFADAVTGVEPYAVGLVHWNEGAPNHLKAVAGTFRFVG